MERYLSWQGLRYGSYSANDRLKTMAELTTRAKKKCWKYFSIFIRTRDCIKTTGDPEWGICVTCNNRFHFKQLQAGHYVQGRNNAVLFHEDLVHAQCKQCNIYKNGNLTPYAIYMFKTYGTEKMEEYELLRHQVVKRSVFDYDMLADDFKKRTKLMLESVSLPISGSGSKRKAKV